jgi:hypothetical protein
MLLELMAEFGAAPGAHADDRRHHARPAAGRQRRHRQRGVSFGAHEPRAFGPSAAVRGCTPPPNCTTGCCMPRLNRRPRTLLCCLSSAAGRARQGLVWDVLQWGQPARAFALRFDGRVVAYLNRCVHVPTEMDWQPGEFLDMDKRWILCSIHGAELRAGRRPLRRRPLRPRPADADRRARSATARCIGILPATSGRCLRRPPGSPDEPPTGPGARRSEGPNPATPRLPPLPAPAAAAAPALRRPGLVLELARELLREQRSERRWRIFFRLAWLGWRWRGLGLLAAHATADRANAAHRAGRGAWRDRRRHRGQRRAAWCRR